MMRAARLRNDSKNVPMAQDGVIQRLRDGGAHPYNIAIAEQSFRQVVRSSGHKSATMWPNLVGFRNQLAQFSCKLKWRQLLMGSEGHPLPFRCPKKTCGEPLQVINVSLAWVINFKSSMMRAIIEGRKSAARDRSYSNITPLVRYALRILKENTQWTAFINDKDKGFSLIKKAWVASMADEVMNNRSLHCRLDNFNACNTTLRDEYRKLCKDAVAVYSDDTSLANKLHPPERSSPIAKLQLSIKTHKNEGDVGVRNIHAAPKFAFIGIAAWVQHIFSSILQQRAPHLLRDSFDLKEKISQSTPIHDEQFAVVDIKDYYLSGTEKQLVNDAADIVDSSIKPLMQRCLHFLLGNQYVINENCARTYPSMYKVTRGTGMGLVHSGDMCDAILFSKVEADLDQLKVNTTWAYTID